MRTFMPSRASPVAIMRSMAMSGHQMKGWRQVSTRVSTPQWGLANAMASRHNTFVLEGQRRGISFFGWGGKKSAETATQATVAPLTTTEVVPVVPTGATNTAVDVVVNTGSQTPLPHEVLESISLMPSTDSWWFPSAESFFNWATLTSGLPGWAVIILSGLAFRALLLPNFLRMQRSQAWIILCQARLLHRGAPLMAGIEIIQKKLTNENPEVRKEATEELAVLKNQLIKTRNEVFDEVIPGLRILRHIVAPMLVVMVCYSFVFWGLQQAILHNGLVAQSPFLWLPSMRGMDPYFILPVLATMPVLVTLEITNAPSNLANKLKLSDNQMRSILYTVFGGGTIFMGTLLSIGAMLFITSNAWFHVIFTALMQNESFRKRLGFPELSLTRAAMRGESQHIDLIAYSKNLPPGSKVKPYSKQPFSEASAPESGSLR